MGADETAVTRISQEIGERLATWRRRRGLSQERLAALTGVTRDTVRLYELGVRSPRADSLIGFAVVLGVTVDELLPAKYQERFNPLQVSWQAAVPDSSPSSGESNDPPAPVPLQPRRSRRRSSRPDLKFRFRRLAA